MPLVEAVLVNLAVSAVARSKRALSSLLGKQGAKEILGLPEPEREREIERMLREGRISAEELISALPVAAREPGVLREVIDRFLNRSPAIANTISLASSTFASAEEEIQEIKSVLLPELMAVKRLLLYYYVPTSVSELADSLRVPRYIDSVLLEEPVSEAVDRAVRVAVEGGRAVILGQPGVGKTVALYLAARKLISLGIAPAIPVPGRPVGREHERHGVVLLLDDAPKRMDVLSSIRESGAGAVLATARVQDWERVGPYAEDYEPILISEMSDRAMEALIDRYSSAFGIEVEEGAKKLMLKKARGVPVYVRWVFEEADRKGLKRISEDELREYPTGFLNYVAKRILDGLLFSGDSPRRGALAVAMTLRILGNSKDYKLPERVLDKLFDESRKLTGERGTEVHYLYLEAKSYLAREPRTFSISYPHDCWGDVIVHKMVKARVIGIFSYVESRWGSEFGRLLKDAFASALREAIGEERDAIERAATENGVRLEYATPGKALPVSVRFEYLDKSGVVRVSASRFEIGRNPETGEIEIREGDRRVGLGLRNFTVSRRHVEVRVEDGVVVVRDLWSKNGTYVRGEKIRGEEAVSNEFEIGFPPIRFVVSVG